MVTKSSKEYVKKTLHYESITTERYVIFMILVILMFLIPIFVWINVLVIYFVRRKIAAKVSKLSDFVM